MEAAGFARRLKASAIRHRRGLASCSKEVVRLSRGDRVVRKVVVEGAEDRAGLEGKNDKKGE